MPGSLPAIPWRIPGQRYGEGTVHTTSLTLSPTYTPVLARYLVTLHSTNSGQHFRLIVNQGLSQVCFSDLQVTGGKLHSSMARKACVPAAFQA
jgi:hypothetical protein